MKVLLLNPFFSEPKLLNWSILHLEGNQKSIYCPICCVLHISLNKQENRYNHIHIMYLLLAFLKGILVLKKRGWWWQSKTNRHSRCHFRMAPGGEKTSTQINTDKSNISVTILVRTTKTWKETLMSKVVCIRLFRKCNL